MSFDFPPLDCHAHIDPTVTSAQVATLGGAQVFAMTRSLDEAQIGLANRQPGIYWAVGAHPGLKSALEEWSSEKFVDAAEATFLVGEVGLDSGRALEPQTVVFREALARANAHLVSIHSSGRVNEVLDVVEATGARGVILHWFTGDGEQIARARKLGCYFSVNAAMADEQLRALPYECVLPETDFPASRSRTRATKPGDIRELERRVVRLTQTTQSEVRRHWYAVLGRVIDAAGVHASVPSRLADLIRRAPAVGRGPWQQNGNELCRPELDGST